MENKTQWLKSPISERAEQLQPEQILQLRPYFGVKRKFRLCHTSYLIGSDPSCDLVMQDPFLSSQHARLKLLPSGEGYEIEDLGSKNGIFLNGLRIARAKLPRAGELRLGRSTIRWKDESELQWSSEEAFICADPFMLETLERLKSVARSNLPVMLLGETGTGKDLLANFIHRYSQRAKDAFVVLNSATAGGALVDSELFGHKKGAYTGSDSKRLGAIMSAHNGTLFLDEIADLPLETQVKLLRTLESGEVRALGSDTIAQSDFRLVTATSQNIDHKIATDTFRLDLYYRVAGYVVYVPPLRERPKDILAITTKIMQDKGFRLTKECEGELLSYPWPGNIRELKSTVERAMVLATAEEQLQLERRHFIFSGAKKKIEAPEGEVLTMEAMERQLICDTLTRTGWSKGVAAKELGIARSTLFEKMRRYGIRDSLNH